MPKTRNTSALSVCFCVSLPPCLLVCPVVALLLQTTRRQKQQQKFRYLARQSLNTSQVLQPIPSQSKKENTGELDKVSRSRSRVQPTTQSVSSVTVGNFTLFDNEGGETGLFRRPTYSWIPPAFGGRRQCSLAVAINEFLTPFSL